MCKSPHRFSLKVGKKLPDPSGEPMTGKFKRAREVMRDHYVAVIGVITKDTAASERHKPSTHRGDSIRLLRGSENASYWWVQVHILLLTVCTGSGQVAGLLRASVSLSVKCVRSLARAWHLPGAPSRLADPRSLESVSGQMCEPLKAQA